MRFGSDRSPSAWKWGYRLCVARRTPHSFVCVCGKMPNINVAKRWQQYAKERTRVHVEGRGYGTLMYDHPPALLSRHRSSASCVVFFSSATTKTSSVEESWERIHLRRAMCSKAYGVDGRGCARVGVVCSRLTVGTVLHCPEDTLHAIGVSLPYSFLSHNKTVIVSTSNERHTHTHT